MSSIDFNNLNSYNDFGLKIENIPSFSSTNAEYENINIDGRDGSLNIFKGFRDNPISFNFVFKAREDFESRKASIVAWLNSKNNTKLIYSMFPNINFNVKQVQISNFKTSSRCVRRFTATFILHPFSYLQDGTEVLTLTKATTIYNNGTYKSKPLLHVFGNGDITIYINNQALVLKNVENEIEIDSEIMNCYKIINGAMVNTNDKMYSPFPTLSAGENNISWVGNVSKIEIEGRWCNL